MMTLDEAIIHCDDVANDRAGCCEDCAEEHRQLAEWLKELKAYKEQTELGKVRCINCEHLYTRDTQWQAAPVCICRAKIWDGLHRAPHMIGHDPCLPIRCDHFEKKKDGQRND